MSLFRKTVALAILALYASTVVTLDLHHNHAVHLPGSTSPAIALQSGDLLPLSQHHDPCPVLQFSLAHALAPTLSLVQEYQVISAIVADAICHQARIYLTPSERAPPIA